MTAAVVEPLDALADYHAWIESLPEPKGVQVPRIHVPPPVADYTWGPEAVELAASAGLLLDPWQCTTLDDCMARRDDGPEQWGGSQWGAFEFGQVVSRQNGKGGWIEARELHAMFVGREELIIHTAHKFDTSAEAFLRIRSLIKNTEELEREVVRESNSHGKEGIWLRDGTRLLFKARSTGAGRGFSADLLIWDEAMYLTGDPVAAMLPTLSARVDPQVIYTGSAGWEGSVAFGRLRRRCLRQGRRLQALAEAGAPVPVDAVERIAWQEFSADAELWARKAMDPADPAQWAWGNPGMGYRIMVEIIRSEMGAMGGPWSEEFGRERLGIGSWPTDEDEERWAVVSRETWNAAHDPASQDMLAAGRGQVGLGIEMEWDRSALCIGLAGYRTDGRFHVEIPLGDDEMSDYRSGATGWLIPRVLELVRRHRPAAVVMNGHGPAEPLIVPLQKAGVEVRTLAGHEVAGAYGLWMDCLVRDDLLRHLNDAPLTTAMGGAETRKIGSAVAFDEQKATTPQAALIACSNAMYGLHTAPKASGFFAAYK